MGKENSGIKLIANNKKAYHDFFIEEKYEAGIALFGTEIKSLRQGKCSIKESYIGIENGEAFIYKSLVFLTKQIKRCLSIRIIKQFDGTL